MPTEIAFDDIVRTREEGEDNEREPLLVLEPLLEFLDRHDLGAGEPEVEAVGDGHSNVTFLVRRGDAVMVLRRPPRG
ncbi:MAG TPA: phosphotransferase family protein, partial [Solirubrobacteraceae bacterium]